MKITIKKSKKTIAPIKTKGGKITHTGIYPRQEPIGWSRLYMHLWYQAAKEKPNSTSEQKESWVLETLDIINFNYRKLSLSKKPEINAKAKMIKINPSIISHDDVKQIIGSIKPGYLGKPFIEFDPNLRDKNDDDWFYANNKYKKFFPAPIKETEDNKAEFKGWWKSIDHIRIKDGFKFEKYISNKTSFIGLSNSIATYNSHPKNNITFYNNASDDETGTSGAFRDIYTSIKQAKHLIFIADWTFHPYMKLLHNKDKSQDQSIGHLLLDWAHQNKDGQVAIHTWDHTNIAALDPQNDYGLDHLKRINSVNFEYNFPNNLLWRASSRTGTGWSHHQKFVVLDYDAGNGKRAFKAFIGGLDLTQGRFDWHEHPILKGDPLCAEFHRTTNKLVEEYDEDLEITIELEPEVDDWYNAEFNSKSNRKEILRQPWRDIHCCIDGPSAHDVMREFVGRWNLDPASFDAMGHDDKEHIQLVQKAFKSTFDSKIFIQQWDSNYYKGDFQAQLVRSMPKEHWGSEQIVFTPDKSGNASKEFQWGIADQEKEKSIQEAYIQMINKAEKFIYIESQYFIGSDIYWHYSPDGSGYKKGANNKIPECLINKILQKAKAEEAFHVYLILPMFPEGDPASSPMQGIRDLQWNTISYLVRSVKKAGYDWRKYFTFGYFANWHNVDQPGDSGTREDRILKNKRYMIYVHSKAMIVDDKYCIIGSANLNQRSLGGDRDSELCVAIWPHQNGQPYTEIQNFRGNIWKYYFGLESNDPLNDFSKIQKIGQDNSDLLHAGKIKNETQQKQGYFCTWSIDAISDGLGVRANKERLILDGHRRNTTGDDLHLWPTGYADLFSMDFLE